MVKGALNWTVIKDPFIMTPHKNPSLFFYNQKPLILAPLCKTRINQKRGRGRFRPVGSMNFELSPSMLLLVHSNALIQVGIRWPKFIKLVPFKMVMNLVEQLPYFTPYLRITFFFHTDKKTKTNLKKSHFSHWKFHLTLFWKHLFPIIKGKNILEFLQT